MNVLMFTILSTVPINARGKSILRLNTSLQALEGHAAVSVPHHDLRHVKHASLRFRHSSPSVHCGSFVSEEGEFESSVTPQRQGPKCLAPNQGPQIFVWANHRPELIVHQT